MTRAKIAIIHPQLIEGGGSEAPALWTGQALKDRYDLSLIAMGRIDLDHLNACYGTQLSSEDIEIIEIPIPPFLKSRFDALRGYRLARFCKQNASRFDLMISTYNVMDFGKKGVQFIADFSFSDNLRNAFDAKTKTTSNLIYKNTPFRRIYLKFGGILSCATQTGWKRNLTVTNSDWTGRVMKKNYGIETITIYPPVIAEFPYIAWDDREDGFVSIGRLVPEKGIDKIIDILAKVRQSGLNFHYHIIGDSGLPSYIRHLQDLCRRHRDWLFMEGAKYGREKSEMLALHKYGISGRTHEPFGIAVAETVSAGCITFVPKSGGQTEIVNHPLLMFRSAGDAIYKIDRVLRRPRLQYELQQHLDKQKGKFSVNRFESAILLLTKKYLSLRDMG